MNPEVFAEWLRRQGRRVVRTRSSYWYNMGPRALQAFPYHWLIEPEEDELSQVLRQEKAIALKFSTPLTAAEGCVSYHMIYDKPSYDFSDVHKKSRSLVRAGLRACKVGQISFERYAAESWRMQQDTMNRQHRRTHVSEKSWRQMVVAASTLDGFEVWGAEVGGELGACVFLARVDDCVSILFQQSYKHLLHLHVNNALTFVVTQNLLQRPGVRVINYGLHSLDAPSSVDQFKLNMGYTPKPLRQRVSFHPWTPRFVPVLVHGTLESLLPRKPENSVIAKAIGFIRFHAQGKLPLSEQDFPALLKPEREKLLGQQYSSLTPRVNFDLAREKMKILMINHYAGSPTHGMEFRPHSMAREWVRMGHSVRIVAASFSHLRYEQPTVTSAVKLEHVDGIEYCWLKTPHYHRNGVSRAWNVFWFLLSLVRYRKSVLAGFDPDAIVASSTYPFDNYIAHRYARKHNAKHVFELHDLWPLSLTEPGGMSPLHPFVLLVGIAERYTYRTADLVVSLLPGAEPHMRLLGLGPKKFVYIPNGVDDSALDLGTAEIPESHRATLSRLKAQGHLLLGYVGGHALANALDNLIRAGAFLKEEPVSIVLVGDGAQKRHLQTLTKELGLANVHFLPPVHKEFVQTLLEELDVLYIGWQRKPIYRFGVSPNKLMDYMAAAKPILHACDVYNDLVEESNCGLSIAPEDPRALALATKQFLTMPKSERAEMGKRGREYVMQHFRNSILAREYVDSMMAAKTHSE